MTPEVFTAANRLPWHHRDPAGRFIITDARIKNCPIMTSDEKFDPYQVEVVF